jgi:UPF0755 protein
MQRIRILRDNHKKLLFLFASLAVMLAILCGLTYMLAGDEIIDYAKKLVLQISLVTREDDLNATMENNNTANRFTIYPGDTALIIGQRLVEEGYISDAELFADYVQFEELDVKLEVGTYFLDGTLNIKQVAVLLTDSSLSQLHFTIIPGQRLEQIAESIDADPDFGFSGADFMAVVGPGVVMDTAFIARTGWQPGKSLEGFMYPDTYFLQADITAQQLRDMLIAAFNLNVNDDLRNQAINRGYSLYEMVNLAAIVEREAREPSERPLIAGVYLNRLETEGWRLDADPTVQYPIGQAGNWWPILTRANYQNVISDYNTYRNGGLPPGPVANPSLSSIMAAINPEVSDYFFFRADCRNDGFHDFSLTFEEHANRC